MIENHIEVLIWVFLAFLYITIGNAILMYTLITNDKHIDDYQSGILALFITVFLWPIVLLGVAWLRLKNVYRQIRTTIHD